MIRSLLFIPGNLPNMLQNAYLFDADAIIFDLEDSVHILEKDNARNLCSEFLLSTKKPLNVENLVRINSLDSPFFMNDLETLVSDKIDGIVVPKATIEILKKLNDVLSKIENIKNMTTHLKLIPIIESAFSVLEVDKIASLPRVSGLLLGAEDLARDLGITRTKKGNEIFYAREKVIMACAAFNILAIDTPYTDVYDDEGLKEDVLLASSLGMKAKSAIHPRHIEWINKAFSPSMDEIKLAFLIIDAKKKADLEGKGAFSVNGKMVDKPIIDKALDTIARAKAFHLISDENDQ
ncbi:MAG: CoA ester lyase [Candidatus Izemoplasmatales bacterium]|nr:CoA ester lyase [Candidatus Izemoplasmatales bacterium]